MERLFTLFITFGLVAGTTLPSTAQFWQPLNGPYGGKIDFVISNHQGLLFAGIKDSVNYVTIVYRSNDDGSTWEKVENYPVYGSYQNFFTDRLGNLYISYNLGLYKSSDGGETWSQVSTLPNTMHTMESSDAGILFSHLAAFGVYRSQDGGVSWQLASDSTISGVRLDYDSFSGSLFTYGAYNQPLLRSLDDGETWDTVFNQYPHPWVDGVAISEQTGDIFVGVNHGDATASIWRSTDDGVTWDSIAAPGYSDYTTIEWLPSGRLLFGNRYYSDDNGDTWQMFDVNTYSYQNESSLWGSLSGRGLYRSYDDGVTWQFSCRGIPRAEINELEENIHGDIFATTSDGLFRSVDMGDSWDLLFSNISPYSFQVEVELDNDGEVFLLTDATIYRSTDNGVSFESVSPTLQQSWHIFTDIAVHPDGSVFITTNGNYAFLSEDNGNSWQTILSGYNIVFVYVLPDGDIIAQSFDDELYLSSDKGLNWTSTSMPPVQVGTQLNFLTIGPNAEIIASITDFPAFKGFYQSMDKGQSWEYILPNIPNPIVRGLAFNAAGELFITSDSGVYRFSQTNELIDSINVPDFSQHPRIFIPMSQKLFYSSANGVNYVSKTSTVSDIVFLRGVLKDDINLNCVAEPSDTILHGLKIRAVGSKTYYGYTNSAGVYNIPITEPGDYVLEAIPQNQFWSTCPVSLSVPSLSPPAIVQVSDLLLKQDIFCPLLEVNFASPLLRRCFDGHYVVHYCNNGTAPAENAYLELQMDDFLELTSAELPITAQNGQIYTFQLGNLGIGECGDFKVYFNVSCDAALGQTHCTEAHIYPDSICGNHPGWDGGIIEVEGSCVGDNVHFSVANTGTGVAMELPFTLVKDGEIIQQDYFQAISPGESLGVLWGADGDYFSIQVENPSGYPYPGKKMAFVENCGGQNNNSWFAGSLPAGDSEPFIAIDCQQNIGSFDPNDKSAFPVGFGDEHFIERNTSIDYRIRFQNTGTDTAFTVVIADTLSAWLDPASIRLGASSHPYIMDLSGNDQDGVVLKFRFPDIMLPDSNINEPASHGFIQFTVSQKADNPLGTIIENNAAIYFDFNEPVITNTVRHKVGENFIVFNDVKTPVKSMTSSFTVMPNPAVDEVVLKLNYPPSGTMKLYLLDARGQIIRVMQFIGSEQRIPLTDFPNGLHFVNLVAENGWSATTKFVVAGK